MASTDPVTLPPPIPPDLLFLFGSDSVSNPPHSRLRSCDLVPVQTPTATVSAPSLAVVAPSSPIVVQTAGAPSKVWVSKVKASFQPLSKVATPTLSDEGIPSVQAPDSIILGSSSMWKDHIVAHFHGTPPSPTKIHADLNPIWGKNGNISIKKHSAFTCLIFIPCLVTRQWVLDVGLWNSGHLVPPLSTGFPVRAVEDKSARLDPAPAPVAATSQIGVEPKAAFPPPSGLQRSQSLPLADASSSAFQDVSSGKWTRVVHRSKPPRILKGSNSNGVSRDATISNSKFGEEEELIKSAQEVIRKRLAVAESSLPSSSSLHSKKERKKLRKRMHQMSEALSLGRHGPGSGHDPGISACSSGRSKGSHSGLASGGHGVSHDHRREA
ncbi:hypothetical protein Bca101_055831 [Brassica carinata]